MKHMRFIFVAGCCLFISGCAYTQSKSTCDMQARSVNGLKNRGAFPSENFGKDGASCGTRTIVDGYIPICNVPSDGDEFDPRNQIIQPAFVPVVGQQAAPVTYIQQPTGGFGVSLEAGQNSDLDPMISASIGS